MLADTEAVFVLLCFSFVVGMALGAFYDAIMLFVDGAFPEKTVKKEKIPLPHNAEEAKKALLPLDKRIYPRDIVLFFTDITFCAISACTVIVLLYHLNYGRVRILSLVASAVGFALYRKTVGRPIRFVAGKIIHICKILLILVTKKIFCAVLKPFKRAFAKTALPVFKKIKRVRTKRKALACINKMLENEEKRSAKRKRKNEKTKHGNAV